MLNMRAAVSAILIILLVDRIPLPLIASQDTIRARIDLVVVPAVVRDARGILFPTFDAVQEQLEQHQIQVFDALIGEFFPLPPTGILRSYVEPTGGIVFRAATQQRQLEAALRRIIEWVRHQYVVTYVSDNLGPTQHSVFRKLNLRTSRKNLRVIYRREYLQYPLK